MSNKPLFSNFEINCENKDYKVENLFQKYYTNAWNTKRIALGSNYFNHLENGKCEMTRFL